MLYKQEKFQPSGIVEYAKLGLTLISGAAHIGLNIALSVLIGTSFRSHAPWAFLLAISMAVAWTASSLLLLASMVRVVRLLNNNFDILRASKNALVLPVGAESLAAAIGSGLLTGSVVWVTHAARPATAGVTDAARFQQFDIYFPLAIGFQVLALPGFVRLADIFGYAEAKATRELDNLTGRNGAQKKRKLKADVATGSTQTSSLISAESLRAAQRELDSARSRQERREKNLMSVSTGGSAQSIRPQAPNLIPMVKPRQQRSERSDRRRSDDRQSGPSGSLWSDKAPGAFKGPRHPDALTLRELPETRVDIFSSAPANRDWV